MDRTEPTDWQLLERQHRDVHSFRTLFDRHRDYVYRLATGFLGDSHAAEDVTQEVFLRIHRMRRRWVPRAQFRTWLYRTALNISREFMRRRKRYEVSAELARVGEAGCKATVPRTIERDRFDLHGMVDRLPDRQREAVVLRFLERLSTRETAQIMRCREGTVKSHLHKAMIGLRRDLKRQKEMPGVCRSR